jgi:hypothetical protein
VPCRLDCYFDRDTGSGDDACFWDHRCDPLEVAPSYTPAGPACAYNPNQSITGFGGNCAMAATAQSPQCSSVCGTRVPNGCDCFGCCVLPGVSTPVYLGTKVDDEPTCSLDAGVCGLPGQPTCPAGESCVTGCCRPSLQ